MDGTVLHLSLVVARTLHLHDGQLVLLSLRHQDGSLDEETMAGLNFSLQKVRGLLGVPGELLDSGKHGYKKRELHEATLLAPVRVQDQRYSCSILDPARRAAIVLSGM